MRPPVRIVTLLWLVAVLAAGLWLLLRAFPREEARRASYTASVPVPPGQTLRDDWPAEEVFRRAFWRHPGAGDRIVHAVRLEWSGDDGVSRWAWFLQLHPGSELLRDLRDPATFGLAPSPHPRPWLPDDLPAPDWFLRPPDKLSTEILQHPSQSLTLFYRPSENLLFASDHGQGFARPLQE